ncbi:MAG: phage major capsid protein [Chthoniobacterales bacterium]
MKTKIIILVLAIAAGAVHAAEEQDIEAKLREGLKNTMLQLRDAQNKMAVLQTTQVENEQKIKSLTTQIDTLNKQAMADKNTYTNMTAELNAKIEQQGLTLQGYEAAIQKWKKSYGEVTLLAQKKESERAILAARVIKLDRQVADQQIKNIQMHKLGIEVLDRYEKFGLGDAVLAREPFTGITRVKFQNLIQDYQDKLADQRIKP